LRAFFVFARNLVGEHDGDWLSVDRLYMVLVDPSVQHILKPDWLEPQS
jgi:hypothetical protein